MRRVWTALLAPVLLTSTALAGPTWAPGSLDNYFRVDSQVNASGRGPVLEGYIYNKSNIFADRMRLRIDQLDATGTVVGSTGTWVLGGVPANGRAWFEAQVPTAASYRVEITSFDWLRVGGGM